MYTWIIFDLVKRGLFQEMGDFVKINRSVPMCE